MSTQKDYIQPGPIDPNVLYLQRNHRSEAIWQNLEEAETTILDCRRNTGSVRPISVKKMHPRVVALLRQSSFYGLSQIPYFSLDRHLITALVERWRPETHTFHLLEGECTVTLQDVGIQTGLPIHGRALIGTTRHDWYALCVEHLGTTPPPHVLKGSLVRLSWLVQEFPQPGADADDITIERFTRAYILCMLAGYIFVTKDTGRANLQFLPYLVNFGTISMYSWGSACLAFLYRELCTASRYPLVSQISGPLFLLQVWAWDRFPFLTPRVADASVHPDCPLAARRGQGRSVTMVPSHMLTNIRFRFDTARQDTIIWEPYIDDMIRALLNYCLTGLDVWTVVIPLICIYIVEWHPADRVLRQFGYHQPIPRQPPSIKHLHDIDLRRSVTNWVEYHSTWVAIWDQRTNYIQRGTPVAPTMHYHSPYMEWYRRITRRWIGVQGASIGSAADSLEIIGTALTLDIAHRVASNSQRAMHEDRRSHPMPPSLKLAPQVHDPYPNIPPFRDDQVRRRRSRGQPKVCARPRPRPQGVQVQTPLSYHPIESHHTTDDGPSSSTVAFPPTPLLKLYL